MLIQSWVNFQIKVEYITGHEPPPLYRTAHDWISKATKDYMEKSMTTGTLRFEWMVILKGLPSLSQLRKESSLSPVNPASPMIRSLAAFSEDFCQHSDYNIIEQVIALIDQERISFWSYHSLHWEVPQRGSFAVVALFVFGFVLFLLFLKKQVHGQRSVLPIK